MSIAAARPAGNATASQSRSGSRAKRHYGTHIFLVAMAVMWLVPLGWALFTALRPVASTNEHGYFSVAGDFNFDNFVQAWTQGGFATYFWNSVIITVPSVLLTLFLASLMAFAVSRVNWKFNITLLIMFTAGNLLPRRSWLHPCSRWPNTWRCRTRSATPATCSIPTSW
ncbi:hypothetical protein NG819_06700 [Pseudarthrobacter sp. Fe7]|nr:hypothetical protein NG819_06700 [Pseudarthrobacter sp. Fe7]